MGLVEVTFPASYKVLTYVRNSLYIMCQVRSHYKLYLIKAATSVYIFAMSSACSAHTLACGEYFHLVRALFHMQVFLKFKSSCTINNSSSNLIRAKLQDTYMHTYIL